MPRKGFWRPYKDLNRPHHKAGLKWKYQTCSRFEIAILDRFQVTFRFDIPIPNLSFAIKPAYDEACWEACLTKQASRVGSARWHTPAYYIVCRSRQTTAWSSMCSQVQPAITKFSIISRDKSLVGQWHILMLSDSREHSYYRYCNFTWFTAPPCLFFSHILVKVWQIAALWSHFCFFRFPQVPATDFLSRYPTYTLLVVGRYCLLHIALPRTARSKQWQATKINWIQRGLVNENSRLSTHNNAWQTKTPYDL